MLFVAKEGSLIAIPIYIEILSFACSLSIKIVTEILVSVGVHCVAFA
jgi:hypothetical protein